MKKWYINAIIYSILVVLLVLTVVKADRLEAVNQDWSATYQLTQYSYGTKIFKLNNELTQLKSDAEQWKQSVESRDEIIEWYKNQPPKIEIVKEIVIEIKEVEVDVEIIREVEVYHDLENFADWHELTRFLIDDDTNNHVYLTANSDGTVQFNGQCEDYSFQLMDRAKLIGKYLDTELLTFAECRKYQNYISADLSSMTTIDGHYINKATIGNEVWFVEPQNDNMWHVYNLD